MSDAVCLSADKARESGLECLGAIVLQHGDTCASVEAVVESFGEFPVGCVLITDSETLTLCDSFWDGYEKVRLPPVFLLNHNSGSELLRRLEDYPAGEIEVGVITESTNGQPTSEYPVVSSPASQG